MLLGVVLVLVDAHHDGDVVVLRRRGDDDLLGAALEVRGGLGAVGEETGGLDDDVGADLAPREGGRVALGEGLDGLAVDGELAGADFDLIGQSAENAVVLQQVRNGLGVAQVVEGDHFDVGIRGENRSEEVAADTAEAVDANADGHVPISSLEQESNILLRPETVSDAIHSAIERRWNRSLFGLVAEHSLTLPPRLFVGSQAGLPDHVTLATTP